MKKPSSSPNATLLGLSAEDGKKMRQLAAAAGGHGGARSTELMEAAHDTIVDGRPYSFQAGFPEPRFAPVAADFPPAPKTERMIPARTQRMTGVPVAVPSVLSVPPATAKASPEATTKELAGTLPHEAPAKPRFDTMKLNKLIVSSYKFMGFGILGVILFGLGSFIFTNVFYVLNDSWVTPMVLSSTDPRVLQLNAQYASVKASRDAIETQRLELVARQEDAVRIVASEEAFQKQFDEAMQANLADAHGQLAMFRHLVADLQATRRHVTQTNQDYSAVTDKQLKADYDAHLIDRDQQVKGGYALAQIASANLALHAQNVDIDNRISELNRQVASLESAGGHAGGGMSYDVLHMQHEYEQSVLASRKAAGDVDAVKKSLAIVDVTLASYDTQLGRIQKAPYMLAADKSVNTAFVPYDNVAAVRVGDDVYSCAFGVLWCKRAGKVAELLDGEVTGKHPLHNREMRGVLVRLTVKDANAMQHPVLHLRRPPLGI